MPPSPSDFPFRLPPYPHQWREFLDHRDDDARALLWQMRTGKTKAVVDLLCYRHSARRDVDGALVLAPNGVHVNWLRRELPTHCWASAPYDAHAWVSETSSRPDQVASLARVLASRRLAVLSVNSEALILPRVQDAIKRFMKGRRVALVVDESHDFRTPGAKRARAARALARRCAVRRILTGTPVANTPLAAWGQFELLAEAALGHRTFGEFERAHAVYGQARLKSGRFVPVLEGYRDLEVLGNRIGHWSSVVLREDAGLPPVVSAERPFALSVEQEEAYLELLETMLLELEHGEVEAIDGGPRLTKLQQICSGFVIDRDGRLHDVVPDERNPRLEALRGELESLGDGKAIIWCRFREDIRKVGRLMGEMGWGHVEYHGAVAQGDRQRAIDAFQRDPAVRAFVGQPRAGGTGIDLSAASAVVWYSHTFDAIERDQATERATRVGGRSVAVVDLVSTHRGYRDGTVDSYVLDALHDKRSVSESLAGPGLRDALARLRAALS